MYIYTYMHVCICTRTDVFVTIFERDFKSRLVELRLQLVLVCCTRPGSRWDIISLSSHLNKNLIYIFSGYIQEEVAPPPLWAPIIIFIIILIIFVLAFNCLLCHSLVFLRLIGWESQGGAAPPLDSVYFIGSSSFNHSSCAGYINSV